MNKIVQLKGREAPKAVRSQMDTLIVGRPEIMTWKIPPFQRPVRVNAKVIECSEEIKREGGVVPGIVTLGRLGTDKTFYLVDGQHRMESFKGTELQEALMDVRICTFTSMAEMAEEFVRLNSQLAKMRPDDILRGLEESLPHMRRVRASCEFVTYGQFNRNTTETAVIGMSQLLRCWYMSQAEVPARTTPPAAMLAQALEAEEADKLIVFMQVARSAWGTDPENYRLWGSLNLSIAMWMWRRLVLNKERGVKRAVVMSAEDFRKCLMSVSATGGYLDWLVGRQIGERDRAPCYARLKAIFVKRLGEMGQGKVMMPMPSWAGR